MNVKIARIKKGITQEQLCEITGIGRTTISKIENGEFDGVRFGLLKRIVSALDSTFEELFLK